MKKVCKHDECQLYTDAKKNVRMMCTKCREERPVMRGFRVAHPEALPKWEDERRFLGLSTG